MTDILAEGRKLLAEKPADNDSALAWESWDYAVTEWFAAHGEALLDCAEGLRKIANVPMPLAGEDDDAYELALFAQELLAALNPGDAPR